MVLTVNTHRKESTMTPRSRLALGRANISPQKHWVRVFTGSWPIIWYANCQHKLIFQNNPEISVTRCSSTSSEKSILTLSQIKLALKDLSNNKSSYQVKPGIVTLHKLRYQLSSIIIKSNYLVAVCKQFNL